ncbi:MAG: hypothetical protein ACYTDY_06445 [Planctomycetota bacterium]|jgi:hypothetical protein
MLQTMYWAKGTIFLVAVNCAALAFAAGLLVAATTRRESDRHRLERIRLERDRGRDSSPVTAKAPQELDLAPAPFLVEDPPPPEPQDPESDESAKIRQTRRLLKVLALACEIYRFRHAEFPPSSVAGGDEVNAGAEALLAHLDAAGLLRECDPRGDTDADERMEIVDAWGNPLIYFRGNGCTETRTYRIAGRDQSATPPGPRPGKARHPLDFVRIWSAGLDGENEDGAGDDVTSWRAKE